MTKKLPSTCAVCPDSAKVSYHYHPPNFRGWYCAHDPFGDDLRKSRIPCRRGALPVPPKWCPRRKA